MDRATLMAWVLSALLCSSTVARAQEASAPPEALEPDSESGDDSSSAGALPWVFIVSGVAALGGGVALVLIGQSRRSEIEDAEVGTEWGEVKRFDDADSYTGAGVASLAVGLVGATIGVIVLASSGDDDDDWDDYDDEDYDVSLGLRIGAGSIALEGRL